MAQGLIHQNSRIGVIVDLSTLLFPHLIPFSGKVRSLEVIDAFAFDADLTLFHQLLKGFPYYWLLVILTTFLYRYGNCCVFAQYSVEGSKVCATNCLGKGTLLSVTLPVSSPSPLLE